MFKTLRVVENFTQTFDYLCSRIELYYDCSSCPDRPAPCDWDAYRSPKSNPQILYGALVSGPDENDNYKDVREDYIYNEVTLDYNAGFQSAVAGLRHLELVDQTKCPERSRKSDDRNSDHV